MHKILMVLFFIFAVIPAHALSVITDTETEKLLHKIIVPVATAANPVTVNPSSPTTSSRKVPPTTSISPRRFSTTTGTKFNHYGPQEQYRKIGQGPRRIARR